MQRPLGDGTIADVTQEPIYVRSSPRSMQGAMLYENEKDAAERPLQASTASQQHEDEATRTDPDYRLSLFDTDEKAAKENWDAETKQLVEETFLRKAKTTPNAVMVVQTKPIPAPFPNYDEWVGDPSDLVLMLADQGHDLERVLFYEMRFGPNRPEVVQALEAGVAAWKAVSVSA